MVREGKWIWSVAAPIGLSLLTHACGGGESPDPPERAPETPAGPVPVAVPSTQATSQEPDRAPAVDPIEALIAELSPGLATEMECTQERGFLALLRDGLPDLRLKRRGTSQVFEVERFGHLLNLGMTQGPLEATALAEVIRALPQAERDALRLDDLAERSPPLRRGTRIDPGQRLLARVAEPWRSSQSVLAVIDVLSIDSPPQARPTLRARVRTFPVSCPPPDLPAVLDHDPAVRRTLARMYPRSTFGRPGRARWDPSLGTGEWTRGCGEIDAALQLRTPTQLFLSRAFDGGFAPWSIGESMDWGQCNQRTLETAPFQHFLLVARRRGLVQRWVGQVSQVLETGPVDFAWRPAERESVVHEEALDVLVVRSDGEPVAGAYVQARGSTCPEVDFEITRTDENGRARLFVDANFPRVEISAWTMGLCAQLGIRSRTVRVTDPEWVVVLGDVGGAAVVLHADHSCPAVLGGGTWRARVWLQPAVEFRFPRSVDPDFLWLDDELEPRTIEVVDGERIHVQPFSHRAFTHERWLVDRASGEVLEEGFALEHPTHERFEIGDGVLRVRVDEHQEFVATLVFGDSTRVELQLTHHSPAAADVILR